MTRNTHTNKSNGGDRVVRTLRVYASGRVVPGPGRPPKDWDAIVARGRAHALPNEDKPAAPVEAVPAVKVKDPRKVAAGKARAAQAAARKLAAQVGKPSSAPINAHKVKAKKAPAKAASKPKAKPAAKAKATPAKRGGARPGSGPKPKSGTAMEVVAFRITPEQKRKLEKLGNGEFVRDRIDRATVPAK